MSWLMFPPLSLAQRRLQRLADDVFGTIAGSGRVTHEARDFGRLVAECLQRHARFGDRIGRADGTADRRRDAAAEAVDAIAQLDHHAFGGLLADAGDARERGDVAALHEPRELVDADARQHRQRDLRADAGHLLQGAEQAAFGLAQETVQRDRVFLHRVVRAQAHFAAELGQVEERRHRRLEFVADTADVEHEPRRLLGDEHALEAPDHRRRLHASRGRPRRCRLERVCACASAIASASAASACSRPGSCSSRPTMCCTCALSPAPVPTTACFTSRAAYSATPRPWCMTAQIAAPRAWPSLSAESALCATNTRSIATSCGAYSATIAPMPSKMRLRRAANASSSPSSRLSAVWNTWRERPAGSTSMMSMPVRWLPGSMPRMRTTASAGWRAVIDTIPLARLEEWSLAQRSARRRRELARAQERDREVGDFGGEHEARVRRGG